MLTNWVRRRDERPLIAATLALALLVRLPFLTTQLHGSVDLDIFIRWVRLIQTRGLVTIYEGTGIDYPPLSLYLLAAVGWLESQLPAALRFGDGALIALIKLPSALADIITAWLIALALQKQTPSLRLLACGLYAFNPAIWYVTAYWAQFDQLYSLCLVLSLVMLARGSNAPAWLAYTVALGIKLQSIALAPLLVLATWRRHGLRGVVGGSAFTIVAGLFAVAPWLVTGQIRNLVRGITGLVPRVDDSAFNFWYLLLLGDVHNVSSELHPLGLPLSYRQIGLGLFASAVLLICFFVWRQQARSLALPAALLNMSLFMFLTTVHERYLFPTVAFVLLAAAQWDHHSRSPRSLWLAYALLTLTFLCNLSAIASFAPGLWTNLIAMQPPYSELVAVLKALALVAAAINTMVFVMLMVELARQARVKR